MTRNKRIGKKIWWRLLVLWILCLGAGVFFLMVAFTGCNTPKNDMYSKIDSQMGCPSEACEELKKIYRNIDLTNLSEKEKELLKLDADERKKAVDDFESMFPSNLVDPNNVSDKDLIFLFRWLEEINPW